MILSAVDEADVTSASEMNNYTQIHNDDDDKTRGGSGQRSQNDAERFPPTSRRCNNYYEWMAKQKEVWPITVTEGLEWVSMSYFHKVLWWIGTCIQMLTLTILSLRTDRLGQGKGYLTHHWKHYSGWFIIPTIRWLIVHLYL